MTTLKTITFGQFMDLTLEPIIRRYKLWKLRRENDSLYKLLDHFEGEVRNGQHGMRDTHKRIVFNEMRQRDLGRRT